MNKKLYEIPELSVHGSVASITQFWGDLGSGDYFTNNIPKLLGGPHDSGCWTKEGYFCENPASTGSVG